MTLSQGDALTTHNFGLQIDGVMVEHLHGVGELGMEQDVIEYSQVTENGLPIIKKMPGVKKAGETTLTRGANQSKEFDEWIETSLRGDMASARKNASIIYMDYQFNPVKRKHLRNAWCSKVVDPPVTAGEAAIMTQTVTIVYEELVTE
ncbi:phage tail protein [Streptomyces paludis]|uniref:Phage tail protein n=1 Tax=Streptomyces paludis TaxID=2282738 RepID=A0A345HLJ3_9ACTN|nr:phage tail protein [Streptomyces paludis]AXG77567.1 phage tail protein [Streptomyces paludis]